MSAAFLPAGDRTIGLDIPEPRQWPCDRGARREPVADPNRGGRVVRHVGWRSCLRCGAWFFSPDVRGVRLHPACSGSDAT